MTFALAVRPGHFGSRGRVRGLIAARQLLAGIVRTFRLAFVPAAAPPATAFCIARAFRPVSRRTLLDRASPCSGSVALCCCCGRSGPASDAPAARRFCSRGLFHPDAAPALSFSSGRPLPRLGRRHVSRRCCDRADALGRLRLTSGLRVRQPKIFPGLGWILPAHRGRLRRRDPVPQPAALGLYFCTLAQARDFSPMSASCSSVAHSLR